MKKIVFVLVIFLLFSPFYFGFRILFQTPDFSFLKTASQQSALSASAQKPFNLALYARIRKERKQKEEFKNLKISAKSAVSIRLNKYGKEKVLFSKNPYKSLPIASLTKLMTALVVFKFPEVYNPERVIKISKEALNQTGSSKWGDLKENDMIPVKELLKMMLIESNNDAAFALTQPIGEEGFVDLMNIISADIGLKNTHFYNSTGLEPDDNSDKINRSTALDLAKLTKYIFINYPQIFEITLLQKAPIYRANGSLLYVIEENTNKLLGRYPEIIGGKTGWSPSASGCLLIMMKGKNKGEYFINIVLGSRDRFGDMEKIINIIKN